MNYTAAVITISDKGSRGERMDTSGPALCAIVEAHGLHVVHTAIVPDEAEKIREELIACADERRVSLVLTTGGTGFSPRDVTPEATRTVIERETPGLPEAMRAASMKVTSRGCLSRGVAGIRGGTLILNLPGSEKAARENLLTVIEALGHGLDMLASAGSAECAVQHNPRPSLEAWLAEAKADASASGCGMYLFHNGVVRQSPRARVRGGDSTVPDVLGMEFDYDEEKAAAAIAKARQMPGIGYVRVWLARGQLSVGDDIMLVLVGGDIRPHVVDALQTLVAELKEHCVTEREQC